MEKNAKTPAEIKKEMGERLKLARQNAGFASPQDFCTQHNLTADIYLQHESGERGIKASNAQEYCKLLKVTLDWLIIGE